MKKPESQLRIALCCRKGGTGKTTITNGLASIFESEGLRTLVVDLDPQGNATTGLGGDLLGASSADCLLNRSPTPQKISESLFLLAGSPELLENEVRDVHPDELGYQSQKMAFDIVLYDCPPGSIALERFATSAATHCLMTVVAHDLAITGGMAVFQTLLEGKERRRPTPTHLAWVANNLDTRRKDDRDIADGLRKVSLGVPVFEVRVDKNLKRITSHDAQRLMEASPASNGALDLEEIVKWVMTNGT